MRLVIQRVSKAEVVDQDNNEIFGSINSGVCVMVGIGPDDGEEALEWACKKILDLRLWPDDDGKPWKSTVTTAEKAVLLISNFTLYAEIIKKGRLDFHNACPPEPARAVYEQLVAKIEERAPGRTQSGRFGAMMTVNIENDGPVTITCDSAADL
jgi:D-aminoacyl-tRNA deacylase